MMWDGQTAVVAGNGPSLAHLLPGSILKSDKIIRINNFFFEPKCFLGSRVDLAFLGGDPRVSRFMVKALKHSLTTYDVQSWCAQDSRVARNARRRLPKVTEILWGIQDTELRKVLIDLSRKYQRHPFTGTYSIVFAAASGARSIQLAGMDMYTGDSRYNYQPGFRQSLLLGKDLARRGPDLRLHNPDLDRELIVLLAEIGQRRGTFELTSADRSSALSDLLDYSQSRSGEQIQSDGTRNTIDDWPHWSGVTSIRMLDVARRVAAITKRTLPHPTQKYFPDSGQHSPVAQRNEQ